jgi:hypothetical protein
MENSFDDIDLEHLTIRDMRRLIADGHKMRNEAIREAAARRNAAIIATLSALYHKIGHLVSVVSASKSHKPESHDLTTPAGGRPS